MIVVKSENIRIHKELNEYIIIGLKQIMSREDIEELAHCLNSLLSDEEDNNVFLADEGDNII